jgi:hypothetical protein
MIPTTYKRKLPKDLSFPVGAKVISEALNGIEQYSKLKLYFSDSSFLRRSEFLSKPKNKETVLVLQLYYYYMRSISKYMIDLGWVGESWSISIYPVPLDRKHEVQQHLVNDGLPKLKKWLSIKRPETWYAGQHYFSIAYNLSTQEFTIHAD